MNNSNSINIFFKNYLSTISFIFLWYLFYSSIPFYLDFQNWHYNGFLYGSFQLFNGFKIESTSIFSYIIILYLSLLIPYYIKYKEKSKAIIIYEYINNIFSISNYKINSKEKTAILAWIVKLFFAPLMIFWLSWHIFTLINNIYFSYSNLWLLNANFLEFFNKNLFYLCFTGILFFDVFFFTLWYLIEIPFLKNKIKSVDSTFFWWFVALACYPPFNSYVTKFLWWYSTDFPKFTNPYIHVILNFSIIILMWIYAWASISLWFKASNLTNRWIISKWPYKYIRHPAYFCKNLSWWIWWLPMILLYINSNIDFISKIKNLFLILLSLIWWSFFYFLRALTEEKHLSKDKEYIKYKNKVKYKFIPKIY